MANASNNGLIDALAWILDSVEIIHAVIKWEVVVPLELPKSLASEGNVPYSAILKQIFEKLKVIQNAVFRRCQGDTKQNNVQRVDGRTEDPKDSSHEIPVELRWVNEALDSVLQVIWGGSTINTEVPGIKGIATMKPQTAKQLNKIRKRCNIIVVKYISLQPKGTTSNRQMKNDPVVMLEEKVEQLQNEIKSLKEEGSKLRSKSDNRQMANPSGATSKTNKQIDELQNKVRTLTEQRDKYAQEMNALKTRLSETLAAQLETDNPNIADLSDALRPTVIAEHYRQLYDNEWTDGFQTLGTRGLNEKQSVQKLFDILKSSYTFCCKLSEKQIEKVLNALVAFESTKSYNTSSSSPKGEADLDVMARRSLHELRRKTGLLSKETAINEYWDDGMIQTTDQDLAPYIERCVELCWYMVLQAPPVYMDPCDSFKKGSDFNKDLFKFYSKSGKHFDFPTWPPLFLHKDGPLLAKGVAEPLA